MLLAHTHHGPAIGGDAGVGVAQGRVPWRFGSEREGRGEGGGVELPHPLIGVVAEHEKAILNPPGPASVLVHPRSYIDIGRSDLGGFAFAGSVAQERGAATFLGSGLCNPDVVAVDDHLVDPHRSADQPL